MSKLTNDICVIIYFEVFNKFNDWFDACQNLMIEHCDATEKEKIIKYAVVNWRMSKIEAELNESELTFHICLQNNNRKYYVLIRWMLENCKKKFNKIPTSQV